MEVFHRSVSGWFFRLCVSVIMTTFQVDESSGQLFNDAMPF